MDPAVFRPVARGVARSLLLGALGGAFLALSGGPFDAQALFALEPHYVRKSEAEVKFPNGLGPGAKIP